MIALAVALASCTGGDKVPARALPDLVLHLADLPPDFRQFDVGRITRTDVPPGPRVDPVRFDRLDGWKARFTRAGSPTTTGPLVVESRADLFQTEDGAERDLAAYRAQFERDLREGGDSGQLLTPPSLGDEAVAMTSVRQAPDPVRFYTVAWRQGNVTASVSINGFDGKVSLEDAIRLARSQSARIADAASSG
jgi:hypothetical protein